jgi:sugar/nucleoside kinase (ribokinase family)
LELIARFESYFDVILGMNEKEAYEIGAVLGLKTANRSPQGLSTLGKEIQGKLRLNTAVLHPVAYAIACSQHGSCMIDGPYAEKPLITTGAGDHFNAGFCLGKLLNFDNSASILLGVSTSGFYVRTGQSPSIDDLVGMLRNWPEL